MPGGQYSLSHLGMKQSGGLLHGQGEGANLHFPIVPVLYHLSVTLSRSFQHRFRSAA